MCGIIGALAFGEFPEKKQEKLRQEAMIFLSSELLQLTQSRGKDATGLSTLFANCDYMGLKMGIPPTDFVSRFGGTEKDFDGYLNIWRKKTSPAKIMIGHCRKSSVGNSEDNVNNHPIKVGDVIGVHNGTLTNHDRIFELLKCKREGMVDSEAIFRLIHHFTGNGKEPFAPEVIQEVCKRLHGSYSCLSFIGNNPYQLAAFRDARPMEFLLIKPLKLLLIASDDTFLKHVIFRYNKLANLYQSGTLKFPALKKSDVELKTMPDDTMCIFDVRKEVDDSTETSDLFITEKIIRSDKIWSSKTTTHAYASGYNRYDSAMDGYTNKTKNSNTYLDGLKKAETEDKDKNKNTERLGMAWNQKSESYQDIVGLALTKDHPNVEIDTVNGEVINADTKKVLVDSTKKVVVEGTDKFELESVDTGIDSLITNQAKIEELPTPVEKNEEDNNKEEWARTEVIVDTHPDILEKAGVAVQEEENFSNIKEVQLALEIDKESDLKGLPIYSLANRIKRFFYKRGWYSGYLSHFNEVDAVTQAEDEDETASKATTLLVSTINKRKAAEANIRTVKGVVNILGQVVDDYKMLDTGLVTIVDKAVENTDLNVALIRKVFKPGDFKTIPILEKITSSLENKNKK